MYGKHLGKFLFAFVYVLTSSWLTAQTYPDKPITIIVPFTPGGVSDITARPLAAAMTVNLNQTILIDNKGGAGGAIGMSVAAKAKPDG